MTLRLEDRIRQAAETYGFEGCAITTPDRLGDASLHLHAFLADGRHGEMTWMAETAARRADPRALWPDCRSIVMLAANYGSGPEVDPLARLGERDRGVIARYAKGRDYHDVVKGRLKHVAAAIAKAASCDVKVFVDTAPLMEKPLAAAAGLGWQGKHTNLVSRGHGSWLFLGAILTTADLVPDAPESDHCGRCRRCLEICPTDAFPAPYQLDARRCISYLTIEHGGPIGEGFRRPMGNRIFGCDDCLAVCPWNKFAEAAREAKFHARAEADDPTLAELLELDDAAFRKRFAGTPVKRTGRDRFLRNVLIAAGNSGETGLVRPVTTLLDDRSPLVRAMAVWALAEIAGAVAAWRDGAAARQREEDPAVLAEWRAVLGRLQGSNGWEASSS